MVGPTMARLSRTRRRKPPKPQRREIRGPEAWQRPTPVLFISSSPAPDSARSPASQLRNEALVAGLVGGVEGGVGMRGVWDDEAQAGRIGAGLADGDELGEHGIGIRHGLIEADPPRWRRIEWPSALQRP